jgi:putative FmdB family regulatory protein
VPILEYQCQNCGHVFERLMRGIGDAPTVTCPKCGRRDVERLLSAFAGRTEGGAGCGATVGGTG